MAVGPENRRQFQDLFDSIIVAAATIDVGNLGADTGATVSTTVLGADLGDFVIATPVIDAIDLTWTAYVQSSNTVEIAVWNTNTSARNLASTTWRIMVMKPNMSGT